MSAACPRLAFTVEISWRPDAVGVGDTPRALVDFLEANGLTWSAGNAAASRLLLSRDAEQTTNADRELVRRWLEGRADVATCRVSDLIDLRD